MRQSLIDGLFVGPRPKLRDFEKMPKVRTVVTLLKESEGPEAIGAAVLKSGKEWLWRPISFRPSGMNWTPPAAVILIAREVLDRINQGAAVFVHCAAGIDRTGVVLYTVARLKGYNSKASVELLDSAYQQLSLGERKAQQARVIAHMTYEEEFNAR